MPQTPQRLNSSNAITESDDTPSQVMRFFANQISNTAIPIVGEGSPEGALEAPQYSLYIDEADPDIPVEYRKMRPSVGGDRTLGWRAI